MLYNLVAKEFMIARYLKLSKNYTGCNCWEIDRAGKGRRQRAPVPAAAVSWSCCSRPLLAVSVRFRWHICRVEDSLGRDARGEGGGFLFSSQLLCGMGFLALGRSQLSDGIASWDH